MGMDLENKDGEWFQCRGVAWGLTLSLAQKFGWEPAGTLPPLEEDKSEPQGICLIQIKQPKRLMSWVSYYLKKVIGRASDSWDMANYYTNDGQRVTDEDAKALADVLLKVRDGVKGTKVEEEFIADPETWFTSFITYFRKGGFSIH